MGTFRQIQEQVNLKLKVMGSSKETNAKMLPMFAGEDDFEDDNLLKAGKKDKEFLENEQMGMLPNIVLSARLVKDALIEDD